MCLSSSVSSDCFSRASKDGVFIGIAEQICMSGINPKDCTNLCLRYGLNRRKCTWVCYGGRYIDKLCSCKHIQYFDTYFFFYLELIHVKRNSLVFQRFQSKFVQCPLLCSLCHFNLFFRTATENKPTHIS